LDRIVQSKFDLPMVARSTVQSQEQNGFPVSSDTLDIDEREAAEFVAEAEEILNA
jgi:hypothetical protein